MIMYDGQPWQPHRSWADPLIAILLLVILVLVGGQPRWRKPRNLAAASQASLEARIHDLVQGAVQGRKLNLPAGWPRPGAPGAAPAADPDNGWDQALQAVHAAEAGDLDRGQSLGEAAPGPSGAAFRHAWAWAYRGTGAAPYPVEMQDITEALGDGYAARMLAARVQARSGAEFGPLQTRARDWATARLLRYALAGLAGVLLLLAGVAFGLWLTLTPAAPAPLPRYGLSGRAVLIVLLGWFLALMVAGPLVLSVVGAAPWLRPLFLPMVYGFHALLGVAYLCRAEGVSPGALWRRVAPDRFGPALATGLGYFALAFAAVLAVALFIGPFLHNPEPPQKDLLELLAQVRGAWTVVLLFLTVAVAAPLFEELMFRGFLLPWLVQHLEAKVTARRARMLALVITGLAFAVMHLQPMGLPTLTTLGIVLGLAFLRTGNLATSVLVHGLWNGGVFVLLRGFR
jgi:membrane protease YdiL (CAAX protease family)